jgi:hypothetical protein
LRLSGVGLVERSPQASRQFQSLLLSKTKLLIPVTFFIIDTKEREVSYVFTSW